MKKIRYAVRELKDSLAYFGLFSSLFDALVLFAVLILIFYLTNMPWWLSVFIAVPYLFIHTRKTLKKLNMKFVEAKVPELEEELRTSADTKGIENNEIVEKLHEDTIKKMKKIRTSYFISLGKLSRQIIFLAILSILIIAASAYNVRFIDVPQTIADFQDSQDSRYTLNEGLLGYEEMSDDIDIFGNKSIAELGDEEMMLELNPSMSDVHISEILDPQDQFFDEVMGATEIEATTDASFGESYSKEYQRIVRYYFSEISKKT